MSYDHWKTTNPDDEWLESSHPPGMGIRREDLSPRIKALMSPEDQQALGDISHGSPEPPKPPAAPPEIQKITKLERDEQRVFANWLLRHEAQDELSYDWSRTDKRSTSRIGKLDFVIYGAVGKSLHLEFKQPGGRVTPEQAKEIIRLTKLGHVATIVHSADEAIKLTESFFSEFLH